MSAIQLWVVWVAAVSPMQPSYIHVRHCQEPHHLHFLAKNLIVYDTFTFTTRCDVNWAIIAYYVHMYNVYWTFIARSYMYMYVCICIHNTYLIKYCTFLHHMNKKYLLHKSTRASIFIYKCTVHLHVCVYISTCGCKRSTGASTAHSYMSMCVTVCNFCTKMSTRKSVNACIHKYA